MTRRRRAAGALAVLATLVAAPPAVATGLAERTFRVSLAAGGQTADGSSSRPSISGDGRTVVFDSTAADLVAGDGNGAVRDVFARDVVSDRTRLISEGLDGQPANGPSEQGVVAADDGVVVFVSEASNLVTGDGNGTADVFVRAVGGRIHRISTGDGGVEANGPSRDPDVSADGRFVVYTSTASNLVPGDANGVEDVFVRDNLYGTTRRITEPGGPEADGASRSPAISPDGRYVAFASVAGNLVIGDTNELQDVFLADVATGAVERVSVSSTGRQQNRSVIAPFTQVSDVSRGGRYVAFDSDATNLVARDRNRDTDVFLRDRVRDATTRVSITAFRAEGDNDSFFPTISPGGRFIAFQSFATNLTQFDAPREDVMVYDRKTRAPQVISVTASGRRRGKELVRQLLQRPAMSSDARRFAFTSTARNLTRARDTNGAEDVFLRYAAAPRARLRARLGERVTPLRLSSDDRAGRAFLCSLNNRRLPCGRQGRLALQPGRYRLGVRAGGPGMLWQHPPMVRRFRVR